MRDRLVIGIGLFLFLALATYPMWHAVYAQTTTAGPHLQLPPKEKTCVAPVGFMRASHMKLLAAWREGAVRNGVLEYASFDGRKYRVNLAATCLGQCHTGRKEFCDRCHTYAAVSGPHCWDCHVDPSTVARRTP